VWAGNLVSRSKEELGMRVFENIAVRIIFGLNTERIPVW
jgi:hypothetical protein